MALAYVGGDRTLLSELLAIFVSDGPVHLAALRDAITHADAAELTRLAHMLKGELRTLGAATAATLAEQLEELGAEGRVDVDSALTLYAGFERELSLLFACITSEDWR
jgi:two-component system sensor histidine kinase/response regulator